jgi:hypothetical protein
MRWIICDRCDKAVPPGHIETHLNSKHKIYYSDGKYIEFYRHWWIAVARFDYRVEEKHSHVGSSGWWNLGANGSEVH